MGVEHGLSLVVTVRCLACGQAYAKPADGGTVKTNPGCPKCGYVGWADERDDELTETSGPLRFFADPLPHRSSQAG
jgi:phage FluMu protein Com